MFNFVIASSNAHKAEELNKIASSISGCNLAFSSAAEKIEVEENGSTYFQNAYLKANAYFLKFKSPVVADDSGLEIEELPGELGVQTAYFGGDIPQRERNALVIEKLKLASNRQAAFKCVLCFILSSDEVFYFEGQLKGEIAGIQLGDGGFGYDPIFCPEGQQGATLAALGDWKDNNSHRARALQAALTFFKNYKVA